MSTHQVVLTDSEIRLVRNTLSERSQPNHEIWTGHDSDEELRELRDLMLIFEAYMHPDEDEAFTERHEGDPDWSKGWKSGEENTRRR